MPDAPPLDVAAAALASALTGFMRAELGAMEKRLADRLGSSQASPASRPLAVTRDEAAELLQCSVRSVDALIATGQLRSIRIGEGGRGVRIAVRELEQWIDFQGKEGTQRRASAA